MVSVGESATEAFWDDFQDGSNDWWSGTVETVQNPVDRATDPYGTLAGAADAGALNFDEGAGGLWSMFDDSEGNTAGPGDTEMWTPTPDDLDRTWTDATDAAGDAADAATPAWLRWVLDNQEIVVVLLVVLAFANATDGTIAVGDA